MGQSPAEGRQSEVDAMKGLLVFKMLGAPRERCPVIGLSPAAGVTSAAGLFCLSAMSHVLPGSPRHGRRGASILLALIEI